MAINAIEMNRQDINSRYPLKVEDNTDSREATLHAIIEDRNSNTVLTTVIANGTAVSGSMSIGDYKPRGLAVQTPAVWTAADIGFEVSDDNTAWIPVMDSEGVRLIIDGVATGAVGVYEVPAGASWVIGNYPYLRLASLDTADGSAENQGAARTLKVRLLL